MAAAVITVTLAWPSCLWTQHYDAQASWCNRTKTHSGNNTQFWFSVWQRHRGQAHCPPLPLVPGAKVTGSVKPRVPLNSLTPFHKSSSPAGPLSTLTGSCEPYIHPGILHVLTLHKENTAVWLHRSLEIIKYEYTFSHLQLMKPFFFNYFWMLEKKFIFL